MDQVARTLEVISSGRQISIGVLIAFILWLCLTYIFHEKRSRFKDNLKAALLGGLPLLVGFLAIFPEASSRLAISGDISDRQVFATAAFICVFGVVYVSLYAPAAIREVFTDYRFAPDPFLLLLPAFIIALGIGGVLREHIQIGSVYSSGS